MSPLPLNVQVYGTPELVVDVQKLRRVGRVGESTSEHETAAVFECPESGRLFVRLVDYRVHGGVVQPITSQLVLLRPEREVHHVDLGAEPATLRN